MTYDIWDKAGIWLVLLLLVAITLTLVATSLRKTRRDIARSYRREMRPVRDERCSITRHNDIIGRDVKRGSYS